MRKAKEGNHNMTVDVDYYSSGSDQETQVYTASPVKLPGFKSDMIGSVELSLETPAGQKKKTLNEARSVETSNFAIGLNADGSIGQFSIPTPPRRGVSFREDESVISFSSVESIEEMHQNLI